MSIESYSLIEHFDYMKNFIPQPFFIANDDVKEVFKNCEDEYLIKTNKGNYSLNKKSLKKLVDSLGIKVKLLSAVCDETDVIDLALPIINKLFKCFADCFVFYANSDDAFNIIDLNANNIKGDEGTMYENGPSPWKDTTNKQSFTCFVDFMSNFYIDQNDKSIMVRAAELMPNSNTIVMELFRPVSDSLLQPMLIFKSKFSDMDGFTDIHPALYDTATGITIIFPMNYGCRNDSMPFEDMWRKVLHLHETTDLNDYIFREINELAISEDSPNSLRNFIANILTDSTLNINQSVKDILNECVGIMSNMKPSKKIKFSRSIGYLVGWALVQKHSACVECGHIHM